nr:ABC transporter substrate-binding protein [Georgenia sp. SYP-B2076]
MRKLSGVTGVVAVAALALAACAQGTGGSSSGEDVTFDPEAALGGSLDVMGFGTDDEVATARVDRTKEALGDVDVTLTKGDLDIQQFLSAVAAGDPPELIYATRDQIGTFASRGAIIPLTACIEGEGIRTEDFRDFALNQVTFDGEVYGIPEFSTVALTMANADLLAAAGRSVEDVNGSSWEAISAATTAMHKADGGSLSVIGYDTKMPEFFPLWARANGAELLSDDGRTARLNDPAAVEALDWAVSVYTDQGGFPGIKAAKDASDPFGSGNQFAAGTLGAMPMEQWYINVLNDVSPDAPMVFDTVRDRQGQPLALAGGSAWAIPADTDNPAAACRWARVMTEVDTWLAAADARKSARDAEGKPFTGLLTGSAAADEAVRALVEPSGSPVWDAAVAAMYEANEGAVALPANPADAEFKTAWEDAVNRVLGGEAEPKASLDQAQEEAQSALDEAWADWDKKE